MYRLEMSLSADGAPEGSELTTCHLTIRGGQQLLTVWQHILKSLNLSAWSWPKVNLPGKPVADQEASTPGGVIYYRPEQTHHQWDGVHFNVKETAPDGTKFCYHPDCTGHGENMGTCPVARRSSEQSTPGADTYDPTYLSQAKTPHFCRHCGLPS